MNWTLLWSVAQGFGYMIGFYFLAACIFMLTARLKKDSDGNLILEPNTWHFKAAYIGQSDNPRYLVRLQEKGLGLCGYFWRVFRMLFFAWPVILLVEGIKFVVYNTGALLFGYYVLPSISNSWIAGDVGNSWLGMGDTRSLGLKKFFPIYILGPLTYWYSFTHYHAQTWYVSEWVIGILFFIGVVGGIVCLCIFVAEQLDEPRDENVGLVRSFLLATKHRFCPRLTIKVPQQ